MSLELKNVSHVVGAETYLDDISVTLNQGSFNVLLGRTLAGKTTLMRIMAGIEAPTSGLIVMDGVDVTGVPVQQRNISMVFQNYALYPHMTVRENLGFGLKIAKQPDAVVRERVSEAAPILGLSELLNRTPAELSGGQRQRVAIARTLLSNPKLLVMDEATSALDYETERKVCDNLHGKLVDQTVFFITHRLSTIRQADVIVMMHQGAIVEIGSHDELMKHRGRYFALYRQQESS